LVETYGTTQIKSCQLNVDVAFPSGWSFSIAQVDQRGSADLDAGVSGTVDITTYFSGMSQQTKTEQVFNGPYSSDYIVTAKTGVAVYSPCGAQGDAALNIKSQIKLSEAKNLNAHGLLTSDSIDSKLTQVYYLNWSQC